MKNNSKNIFIICLRVLFTALLIFSVIFIFYNSSKIGTASSNKSKQVTTVINSVLHKTGTGLSVSEFFVRKLAHFAEFALLGFSMILVLRVYTKRIIAFISWPMFFGLLVAVSDEFLQMYIPGRSSRVSDIVIDFFGVLGGMLCGLMIIVIFMLINQYFTNRRKINA